MRDTLVRQILPFFLASKDSEGLRARGDRLGIGAERLGEPLLLAPRINRSKVEGSGDNGAFRGAVKGDATDLRVMREGEEPTPLDCAPEKCFLFADRR